MMVKLISDLCFQADSASSDSRSAGEKITSHRTSGLLPVYVEQFTSHPDLKRALFLIQIKQTW